jgi:hydrogenase maturation protein HypF
VSPGAFKRLGAFRGAPLPGGDAAIRHPARQLVARWIDAGLAPDDSWTERLHVGVEEIETWETQVRRRLNCPSTHAVGRLFDSFAAGLGLIAGEATYDGQAAVRLEAAARRAGWASYLEVPFAVRQTGGFLEVDFQEAFELLRAPPAAADAGRLANGFHRAVVGAAVRLAELGREMTSCAKVAVSGGFMMNRLVSENLTLALQERGFQIYAASLAPPGDGGIALGQIYAAGGMC